MVFLASVLTQLLVAGTLVLAALIGSGVAYFYVRARRHEAAEAKREDREISERASELVRIRERIEEIYERQQTGSETQFARVNQELKDLQMNLDAKGRKIDGVQGQVRYELKRHEEEIAELRQQLREAVQVFAAAALPAARPTAPALEAHPEPEPPAPKPAQSIIYAPQQQDDAPPAFTPIDDILKDDHELLDDLFGGTVLDSEDEASVEAGAEEVADANPSERPFTSHTVVDLSGRMETRDDFEFVDLDTSMPDADYASAEADTDEADADVGAEQGADLPEDSFASDAQTAAPGTFPTSEAGDAAPAPPPVQWADVDAAMSEPEAEFEERTFGSEDESVAEPAADDPFAFAQDTEADELIEEKLPIEEDFALESEMPSVEDVQEEDAADVEPAEPLPAHSGDGMSTPTFDADPFAGTAAEYPPLSATDLDSTADLKAELTPEPPAGDPFAFETSELAPAEPESALTSSAAFDAAETLTVLSAVDETMQQALYGLGVTTIEAIARWSRTDARRIANHLKGTTEEDLMERWVFEAQSILFERYQDELRDQRNQRLNAN